MRKFTTHTLWSLLEMKVAPVKHGLAGLAILLLTLIGSTFTATQARAASTIRFNFNNTTVPALSRSVNPANGKVSISDTSLVAGDVVVFDGIVCDVPGSTSDAWGAVELNYGGGYLGLINATLGALLESGTGNAADTADPAHDGIINLLKRAFNLNPLVAAPNGVPYGTVNGGTFSMIYRKSLAATDLIFQVQSSSDLVNWSTNGVTDSVVFSDGATEIHAASMPVANTVQFMRLQLMTTQ